MVVGIGLRFDFFVEKKAFVSSQTDELDVIDGGLLQSIEEGAMKKAVGGELLQGGELPVDEEELTLIGESLLKFISTRSELSGDTIELSLGEHGLELEGGAPGEHDKDQADAD